MYFLKTVTKLFSPIKWQRVASNDEPFLNGEDLLTRKESVEARIWKQTKHHPRQLLYVFPWTLSAVLLVALIWTSRSNRVSYYDLTFGSTNEMVTYSPAQHLIKPQNVVFTSGFAPYLSIYQGPSTRERDQAWEDLYSFGITRIPQASAARLVNKTVPIPGEPGQYIVMLKVFHQLHCLNMLRLRLWSNGTYDPNDELMSMEHSSHCIDSLRQALMCSVDITPIPWMWSSVAQEAIPVPTIQHTCRNFEKIREWAKENHLESFDSKVFVKDELRA